MKKPNTLLLIMALLLIVFIMAVIFFKIPSNNRENNPIMFFSNGKTINLELAKTPQEQQKGLMFREHLDEDSGMLFIFQDEQIRSFWMKNTLIPIDIIFIDKNNIIIDIQTAQPCKKDPCPDYISKSPVKYVLEVNEGYAERNNIKYGDKVEI